MVTFGGKSLGVHYHFKLASVHYVKSTKKKYLFKVIDTE